MVDPAPVLLLFKSIKYQKADSEITKDKGMRRAILGMKQ
jgi:hypothetical protein